MFAQIAGGIALTDVDGHMVRAIDGRPATEFYREFFGNVDITYPNPCNGPCALLPTSPVSDSRQFCLLAAQFTQG